LKFDQKYQFIRKDDHTTFEKDTAYIFGSVKDADFVLGEIAKAY
jgi:hypothetical protein